MIKYYFLTLFIVFNVFLLSAKDLNFKSTDDFINYFDLINFNLLNKEVPPVFTKSFPKDMSKIKGNRKIKLFIKIMLPLILKENEKIVKLNKKINHLLKKLNNKTITSKELDFLDKIGKRYNILKKKQSFQTLSEEKRKKAEFFMDYKIRPINTVIALGQAALESGWGTSRFVREGNNLFGHVAKNYKNGIKPLRWKGFKRHIMRFNSIEESICRYMLNLNRNRAYNKFRFVRYKTPNDIYALASTFNKYSRIKNEYLKRLKRLIFKFNLSKFAFKILDNDNNLFDLEKISSIYIF